jgi:hypothetical protein
MSGLEDSKETMHDVMENIMTDMFFLFPDIDDDGQEITQKDNQDDAIHVQIHYHTDSFLHIAIDRSIVHEMAANFIGLAPDEVQDSDIESMALECANILGGNYLVRIDPESKYQLSIPELIADRNIDDNLWKIGFVSEGATLNVALRKNN